MNLQFKEQGFQVQAVAAVVDCFAGQPLKVNRFGLARSQELIRKIKEAAISAQSIDFDEVKEEIGYCNASLQPTEPQLLTNIQHVQKRNNIYESQAIERPPVAELAYNLTIEMETGTGKTYTYIRTMYELHKKYGWSKFIVIVPSIAIREGVYNSFQITQAHFQELYGHQISPFIYNSARPQDIESFAADNRISVMIINTQAFNTRGKDARRIYQELDQFGTRKPIDIIAQTKPILIVDESQSVEGDRTLKSMTEFKPLFTLRYSATHKQEYNKVYRLDALDAYKNYLVKKIQVKGITLKNSTGISGYLYLESISLSTTKPPLAMIEYEKRFATGVKRVRRKLKEGDSFYKLSNNMPAYKNKIITEIDGYRNKIVIDGEDIYPGDAVNDQDENTLRRIQIRECIQSHLQKEKMFFSKGVKILSLFFIDAVHKYRLYDTAGEAQLGDYARIFEEEYAQIKQDFLKEHEKQIPADLKKYLVKDTAAQVHNGYFSIDKKGKTIDSKVKRGREDSEDISAYDLIMKDKERLLSFAEPTRFIFSHSALKEGWDNPNVFQICALKHADGGSLTRRRQEVGRGMRLCVDKNGDRLDFEKVGGEVHEINKLTVIASESYEAFANGLQKEIAATLKDRPQAVTKNYLHSKVVTNEGGDEHRLSEDDADKLWKMLFKKDVIDDDDKITDAGRELIKQRAIILPDNLEPYRESICKLLENVYTGEEFKIGDDRKMIELNTNKNFKKKEFAALWDKIKFKTVYEVQFDRETLINDSKNKIDAQLNVGAPVYELKTGELKDGTAEEMKAGQLMQETERKYQIINNELYSNTVYDLIGEIQKLTDLTRFTLVAILKAIQPEQFALLRKNPEAFIAECGRFINEVKASLIINNIIYHKTDKSYDAKTVFTNNKFASRQSGVLTKHIYDHLDLDSNIESDFAQALESSNEVVVYAKLPKSFYISTPIADYSPDWAIVFDKDKVRHIYFVAETKGSNSEMDLRAIERLKIDCATRHFEAISGGEVKFKEVKNYDGLMEIVR